MYTKRKVQLIRIEKIIRIDEVKQRVIQYSLYIRHNSFSGHKSLLQMDFLFLSSFIYLFIFYFYFFGFERFIFIDLQRLLFSERRKFCYLAKQSVLK